MSYAQNHADNLKRDYRSLLWCCLAFGEVTLYPLVARVRRGRQVGSRTFMDVTYREDSGWFGRDIPLRLLRRPWSRLVVAPALRRTIEL